MADRILAVNRIDVLLQSLKREVVVVGKEAFYPGDAAGDILGRDIDLDTVARGDDDPFGDPIERYQGAERLFHLCRGKGQLFPDFNSSGFMRESDNNYIHISSASICKCGVRSSAGSPQGK